ncbi:MAG: hypothetical protein JNM07_05020 [Phycisphaerae bacterium]|nr:hypothetical protein [Phycisphaerae bacterium]
MRSRVDIVELIAEHTPLQRIGTEHVGRCLFHADSRPSLNVNREKGLYHCFGCGAKGDAITFVQKHIGLDFHDALRHLSEWSSGMKPLQSQRRRSTGGGSSGSEKNEAPKDAGAHRADRHTGNAGAGRTAPADPIEPAWRLRMAAYEMRKKQEAKRTVGRALLKIRLCELLGKELPTEPKARAALLERMARAAKQDGKDRNGAFWAVWYNCPSRGDVPEAEVLRAIVAVYGRPSPGEPGPTDKWRAQEKRLLAQYSEYLKHAHEYGIPRIYADAEGFPTSAHEERDPAFGNWSWGYDPATGEVIEPVLARVLPEHFKEGSRPGLVGFIRRPLRDEIGRHAELRRITGQDVGLKVDWGRWTDPEGYRDESLEPSNVVQQVAEFIRRHYYNFGHECRTLICIGGQFLYWDGRCWVEKSREAIYREAREFLLRSNWYHPKPKRPDANLDGFVAALAERVVVEGAIREGMHLYPRVTHSDRNLPAIPDDGLDDARFLIPHRNGVLSLDPRLGEPKLIPHSPRRLFRSVTDLDWPDFDVEPSKRQCPTFDHFLADQGWLPGSPGVLRFEEMLGLALSGVMDFHVMFFLQGPPRSGKSLTARLLGRMLPLGWVVYKDVSQFTNRFGMSDYARARLVILDEWSDSGRRDGTDVMRVMKQMTGGSLIQVEEKHGRIYQAFVSVKFLATGNRLPAHNDPSGGAATRIEPSVFTKSATGREDRELEQKLAAEIPAIVLRAFAGLKRLMPDGKPTGKFTQTETSREMKRNILADGSSMQEFIALRMRRKLGSSVLVAEVRKAFNLHAAKERQEGMSEHKFSREFTVATGDRAKVARLPGKAPARVYEGWELLPAGAPPREVRPKRVVRKRAA